MNLHLPVINLDMEHRFGKSWATYDPDMVHEYLIKKYDPEVAKKIHVAKLIHPDNNRRFYEDWEVFVYVCQKYFNPIEGLFATFEVDTLDICKMLMELFVWGVLDTDIERDKSLSMRRVAASFGKVVKFDDEVCDYIVVMHYGFGIHAPLPFYPLELKEAFRRNAKPVIRKRMLEEMKEKITDKNSNLATLERFCYNYGREVMRQFKIRRYYYGDTN